MSTYFKDGFCLTRDPFDSNVAFAGGSVYISGSGYQMAIQKSIDAGATWPIKILLGSPMGALQTAVHDIALAPTNTQVIYAAGDENRYVKIWRTPDGGTTWSDITSNLAGHHGNYDEINTVWVSPEDEDSLQARGILYAPDYVVNVGGAMAGLSMETRGVAREEAEREVIKSVSSVLKRIFELAETDGITTGAAARRIAEERLSAAG